MAELDFNKYTGPMVLKDASLAPSPNLAMRRALRNVVDRLGIESEEDAKSPETEAKLKLITPALKTLETLGTVEGALQLIITLGVEDEEWRRIGYTKVSDMLRVAADKLDPRKQ